MSKIYLLDNVTTKASDEGTSTKMAKYITLGGKEWSLPECDSTDYLPLTGGAMTGSIKSSATNGTILNARDDNITDIWASTTQGYGSGLTLFGKNYSSADLAGSFNVQAQSSEGPACCLVGKPDGTLTWNNSNILTTGNTYVSSEGTSTDYVKYITINNTEYKINCQDHMYKHNIVLTIYGEASSGTDNGIISISAAFNFVDNTASSYSETCTAPGNAKITSALWSKGFASSSSYTPVVGGIHSANWFTETSVVSVSCKIVGLYSIHLSATYYGIGVMCEKDNGIKAVEYPWVNWYRTIKNKKTVVTDHVTQIS